MINRKIASNSRLGFIGLGYLGSRIARRLVAFGFPMAVYDRDREKTKDLGALGAVVAPNPETLAKEVDIVLSCLPNGAAVEAVYLGTGRLLESARPGTRIVELSTIAPETSRQVHDAAAKFDLSMLDVAVNWFMYHLGRRLKEKARLDPKPRNAGLNALTWDYTLEGEMREPSAEEILQEINGYSFPDRNQVKGFTELKADGSTACGCWIYSGIFFAAGENIANTRNSRDFDGHGWAFTQHGG
jgi:hypothetical protein